MPPKIDPDTTSGAKLLRMFRKLMLDGRKHFQSDMAEELQCSPQTIIRLAAEIESVVGIGLEYGMEERRRWYRMQSASATRLGVESEELRYLGICRDLAAASLPEQIRKRVDETIFSLSVMLADPGYTRRGLTLAGTSLFSAKGASTTRRIMKALSAWCVRRAKSASVGYSINLRAGPKSASIALRRGR